MYTDEKIKFGKYLRRLREEKNAGMEQLCHGLCDVGILSRYERGERLPNELLQERFLTRLGVPLENHENIVFYTDYKRWRDRQKILYALIERRNGAAAQYLEEYKETYPMEDALEEQFYLVMQAQRRTIEGCEAEELRQLYGRALHLTVPEPDKKVAGECLLSAEELNLILEYIRYDENGRKAERYEGILTYIERTQKTDSAMAKLYPKAVLYLYFSYRKTGLPKEKLPYLLKLCDKAIEILRNAKRMFYLWELFTVKKELLDDIYGETEEGKKQAELYYADCKEWKETLEALYEEFGIPIEMKEFCYLYIGAEAYCIGDIVRIRRKMLGLTIKQLSEGICSERTVSRLECNQSEAQREIVVQLFVRLKLSPELIRTELLTENHEATVKYVEFKRAMNGRQEENAKALLRELKGMVDTKILVNYQVMCHALVTLKRNAGELSNSHYVRKIKQVLGVTIPYEAVMENQSEKYLTHMETTCIKNIASYAGEEERRLCTKVMKQLYEMGEYQYTNRISDFLCAWVASELGNEGEYDASDALELKRVVYSLRNRKPEILHKALYAVTWNDAKRREEGKREHRLLGEKKALIQCTCVSNLCKSTFLANRYKKMLEYGMLNFILQ